MDKRGAILLLTVLMCGCSVDVEQINAATKACASNGGVDRIYGTVNGIRLECRNGMEFRGSIERIEKGAQP